MNQWKLLSEPNQEIKLDFAGPIKYRSRGDVCVLVAIDRCSTWPTANFCKHTDTQTVFKFLAKFRSDNGTPLTIHTDNGSCFKNKEFKEFCDGEHTERIRCTPNFHTGTGLVERTIRTPKSLTRANLQAGLFLKRVFD